MNLTERQNLSNAPQTVGNIAQTVRCYALYWTVTCYRYIVCVYVSTKYRYIALRYFNFISII